MPVFLTLWEGPSTTVGTGTLGRSCVILIGSTDACVTEGPTDACVTDRTHRCCF